MAREGEGGGGTWPAETRRVAVGAVAVAASCSSGARVGGRARRRAHACARGTLVGTHVTCTSHRACRRRVPLAPTLRSASPCLVPHPPPPCLAPALPCLAPSPPCLAHCHPASPHRRSASPHCRPASPHRHPVLVRAGARVRVAVRQPPCGAMWRCIGVVVVGRGREAVVVGGREVVVGGGWTTERMGVVGVGRVGGGGGGGWVTAVEAGG
jgi:hypothetical protein